MSDQAHDEDCGAAEQSGWRSAVNVLILVLLIPLLLFLRCALHAL